MENYEIPENNTMYNDMTSIQVNISTNELNNMVKWAKFRAIMDIIMGALTSLGIITAIFGVPQIIAGIKLLESTSALRLYIQSNRQDKIIEFFTNHRQYFLVSGIAMIIKMVIFILSIMLWAGLVLIFLRNVVTSPQINDYFKHF